MKQILILEDDQHLSNGIVLALKTESLSFTQTTTIEEAKAAILEHSFDLVILDVNLPDGSGIDLLSHLKSISNIPVILLTANDMEVDIVTGLELGADDYITKPFSLMILRARVNLQLRKQQGTSNLYKLDGFEFDFLSLRFQKNNTMIELSKTEQKLLFILVKNKGNTVTRSTLIDYIWTDSEGIVDENALSVSIKRLRDKLGDSAKNQYIKTIYGLGYSWAVN